MPETPEASAAKVERIDRLLVRTFMVGLVLVGFMFGVAVQHGDVAWALIFGLLAATGLGAGWRISR